MDELTRRSAAVAARIAQKEKDAGSDLDTLRVRPVTGHAECLSLLALLACFPQLVSVSLLADACWRHVTSWGGNAQNMAV